MPRINKGNSELFYSGHRSPEESCNNERSPAMVVSVLIGCFLFWGAILFLCTREIPKEEPDISDEEFMDDDQPLTGH